MFRDDYLIRMIKQLAAFLARVAGHNRKGEYEEALREAGQAWDELFHDVPRDLIDVVDSPTLAGMLRDPARMRAAAQLLAEEGRALAGKGDPAHAAVRYRRALELYLEARAIAPEPGDADAIQTLARDVPANQLDARYRSE